MALFLLCKCHSGNCVCSLIDWSAEGMATHAAPVVHAHVREQRAKNGEREREGDEGEKGCVWGGGYNLSLDMQLDGGWAGCAAHRT